MNLSKKGKSIKGKDPNDQTVKVRGGGGGVESSLDKDGKNGQKKSSVSNTLKQQQVAMDKIDAQKRFSESKRLMEAVMLNSTLEEQPWSQFLEEGTDGDQGFKSIGMYMQFVDNTSGKGVDDAIGGQGRVGNDERNGNSGGIGEESFFNKKMLDNLRKAFIGRLFKFNHVLQDNQSVNLPIYHVFLFVEFLQMLFFVFFKFDFVNEFVSPIVAQEEVIQQADSLHNDNATATTGSHAAHLSTSLEGDISSSNSFRFDSYLVFANFHLYSLQGSSASQFTLMYILMNIAFYCFLLLLFFSANRLFHALKNDEIKDATSFAVKILSFLICSFMFILQFPMIQTNIQGYLCEEPAQVDQSYILKDVECGGLLNKVLTACSTVTLIVYIIFLYIQLSLYSSSNIETPMPWGSLDKSLPYFRLAWKLLISFVFILDKANSIKQYSNMACFLVGAVVCLKRIKDSGDLYQSVFYSAFFYDFMTMWLYFHFSLTQFSNYTISISKLIFILTSGICLSIITLIVAERNRKKSIYKEGAFVYSINAENSTQAQLVIAQLMKVMASNNFEDQMLTQGLILYHYEECADEECRCADLIVDFEINLSRYNFSQDFDQCSLYQMKMRQRNIERQKSVLQALSAQQMPTTLMDGMDINDAIASQKNLAFTAMEKTQPQRSLKGGLLVEQLDGGREGARRDLDQMSTAKYQQDFTTDGGFNQAYQNNIGGGAEVLNNNSILYNNQHFNDGSKRNTQNELIDNGVKRRHNQSSSASLTTRHQQRLKRLEQEEKNFDMMVQRELQNEIQQASRHNNDSNEFEQKSDTNEEESEVEKTHYEGSLKFQNSILPQIWSKNTLLDLRGVPASRRQSLHSNAASLKNGGLPSNKNLQIYLDQQQSIRSIMSRRSASRKSKVDEKLGIIGVAAVGSFRYKIQESVLIAPPGNTLIGNATQINTLFNKSAMDGSDENTELMEGSDINPKYLALLSDEPVDEASLKKEEQILKYRFLTLYLDRAIRLFPKSVHLRIHLANVHCYKLDNEFKATFELMKCEQDLPQSLQARFFMFRRRLLIERNLFQRNQSFTHGGNIINAFQVHNYEKLYQRFTKFSYFAANSALNFWQELLKQNIDSQVLLDRGGEISKIHTKLKDTATEITKIAQNDIKFLLQYSTFLFQIVHIEQEAQYLLEKALHIYQRIPVSGIDESLIGGFAQGSGGTNYGENSAVAVVIVALSAEEVGRIIHVSDELQRALGFTRKALIGKNISWITPTPIAIVHDRFLNNFLETAKSSMLNQSRQLFAMTAEGYLRPIQIMLQLYPQLQDKITILGFIQTIDKLDGIIPPKQIDIPEEIFYSSTHHYLMTDKLGNVNCISEGLKEIGLNSKFFMVTNSKYKTIHIESLFGTDIYSPDIQEILMSEGLITQIDTTSILEHINIESISQEETMQAMEKQGIYNVHIQIKRYVFDPRFSVVDLYRIILLPANFKGDQTSMIGLGNQLNNQAHSSNQRVSNNVSESKEGSVVNPDSAGLGSYSMSRLDVSSLSSSASQSSQSSKLSYSTVIQEFKSAIGQRSTPNHLKKLNRILIVILLALIISSGVDYSLKLSYLDAETEITKLLVHSQSRSVRFVQLFQNIRSLVNVANGLEFDKYWDNSLKRVDRFEYLQHLIFKQQTEVYNIITFFSKERSQYESDDLNAFENQYISVYRLTSTGEITTYDLHYKMAFDAFLNKITQLNVTNKTALQMPEYVLRAAPYLRFDSKQTIVPPLMQVKISENIPVVTQLQQDVFFLLINGVRIILKRTVDVEEHLHEIVTEISQNHDVILFMVMMIGGILICTVTLALLIQKITNTERSNQQILEIFSLLPLEEIGRIYKICDGYIDGLDHFEIAHVEELSTTQKQNEPDENNRGGINSRISVQDEDEEEGESGGTKINADIDNAIEEQKDNANNTTIILVQDQSQYGGRVRNPASKFRKMVPSRREFYAYMIQKSLTIIREEEIYQQIAYIKREERNQAMRLYLGEDISEEFNSKREAQRDKLMQSLTAKLSKNKQRKNDKQNMKQSEVGDTKQESGKKGQKYRKSRLDKAMGVKREEINDSSRQKLKAQVFDKGSHHEDFSERSSVNESGEFDISGKMKNRQFKSHETDDDAPAKANASQAFIEVIQEELEFYGQRKEMLRTTSQERRRKCINGIISSFLLVCIFYGYFAYTYFFHKSQLNDLYLIQLESPAFFRRYEDISLQFQYIREKILNHEISDELLDFKLPLLDQQSILAHNSNIEGFYHEESMVGENSIQLAKSEDLSILSPLVEFVSLLDSSSFCSAVFDSQPMETVDIALTISKASSQQLLKLVGQSYSTEITNDIPVIIAVLRQDIALLQKLKNQNAMFNTPDYDRRTPLHVACHAGNIEVVRFLLDSNVNINALDRWGSSPLNDAENYPEIKQLLISRGAKPGTYHSNFQSVPVSLTDNQYRLFYASYYNDIEMMDALKFIGWNVNFRDRSGRSAISVAASEGNLDAVKLLLASGAVINVKDARGNDPFDDAIREGKREIIDLMIDEAVIRDQCSLYENGLFLKGFSQTIGIFNRKFADVEIYLDDSPDRQNLLNLLGSPRSNAQNSLRQLANTTTNSSKNNNSQVVANTAEISNKTEHLVAEELQDSKGTSTEKIMQLFFGMYELYLHQVINRQEDVLSETYTKYSDNYAFIAQLMFFGFLVMQLITLFYLRNRFITELKEEVIHSRGILNLVPERFFRENQSEVEKVIKMISQ